MTGTKYTEGQSLWSRTTGRRSTVIVHSGNRVVLKTQEGSLFTTAQRNVDTIYTTEPQEEIQFMEPEDEPCDLD